MAVSVAHSLARGIKDKNIVLWFTPSDKELPHPIFPDVQPAIYNFDAMPYESVILGYYSMWKGPENNVCGKLGIQKRNEIGMGYSRDGFHFYRPTYEPIMNVDNSEDAWNWGNMQSINGMPLIVGDSLYIYASGRRLNNIFWDGHVSTGLGTLRRDGFVSLRADQKEGFITTEKIKFDGKYLFVNADVQEGGLLVEILDEKENPINGFTKDECIILQNIDKTKQRIVWKKNANVGALVGKHIRLKFYLTNGDLYAFWISPWQSGESRGYTGGGGPGLSEKGIDLPK